MPEQSFNSVDLPYLFEEDGITDRIKGSRNGGDISFNIRVNTKGCGIG